MSEFSEQFSFESEEFDEDFYFDYEELADFEKHAFQNFYNGEYDVAIQRLFAVIFMLMKEGKLQRDCDWVYNCWNKFTLQMTDKYIVILALEDSVGIINGNSHNKIRVAITDSPTDDVNNIVKSILELE